MNMKKWLSDMIESDNKKPLPILSFPGAQLCGFTVGELVKNSEKQALCMKAVAERTACAASVSLMDLSVEAECFGANVVFSDNEVPSVAGAVITDENDAESLTVPQVGTVRTGIYIDAVKRAVELIQDRPVLAGVIGPFSLTGRLVDVTQAMYYCYDEPEMLHTVLSKCTQFLISYILEYKKAGACGVVLAEPLSGLLSPSLEEEFSAPYVSRIASAVQDDGFIVIYHNCGNGTVKMTDSILSNGCAAYHFGNAIDIEDILKAAPSDVPIMGNIDPAGQFRSGTPESITQETKKLLARCSKYPNFIISSGCDIPPAAKWENIDAFFSACLK